MDILPKILVTGADGQLGSAIKLLAGKNQNVIFTKKSNLDITDAGALQSFLTGHKPKVLINTAAYTQVDAAESNESLAFAVNAEAVKNIAASCLEHGSKLIHLSTDYVFDGSAKIPYLETDAPNPVTLYGKSKLAGENYILQSGLEEFAIVRTSWLYSNFGHNFYKTMSRLAETKSEISVVNDQEGSPTYAIHLAGALLQIATRLTKEKSGIYHYSNNGSTTWYGFAKAIFEAKQTPVKVHPIPTSAFPTAAKRPAYSVLNTQKIENNFTLTIPAWKRGLHNCISET